MGTGKTCELLPKCVSFPSKEQLSSISTDLTVDETSQPMFSLVSACDCNYQDYDLDACEEKDHEIGKFQDPLNQSRALNREKNETDCHSGVSSSPVISIAAG